ncbi:polysaccharide deacetylase family protein [Halanaerobacter jeridensis]|uniref:Peptidoglycan/xylan/chitin deacetylase (PgdA/CDA1 family) n=1 Tax=Halanaerobacter jeridensis TaxID=706427 RepID=A0A938XQK0_9FIRM|nr:polysaccharide deacetylase family protein [Halanaerobacter jeridensis]MBM7555483.1 peptidoglycan/xylan/chitin deacetylase (PgdA/CDA1 family) [Halanaerobacter jeridensis]
MKLKYKLKLILLIVSIIVLNTTLLAQANIIYPAQPGDSLFKIAHRFNITVNKLSKLNEINNPNMIYIHQKIVIPEKSIRSTKEKTFYMQGPPTLKVALTFDDGPDPIYTPQVLDVLEEYNVPATFFLLGKRVAKYPSITNRIINDGHTVANHSWSHPDLTTLNDKQLSEEIFATEQVIEEQTNKETALLRPPYGFVSNQLLDKLKKMDYKVIHWSLDSLDWQAKKKEDVLNKTIPYLDQGAIILFHSAGGVGQSLAPTVKVLPIIIEKLQANNIELVTVDNLLSIAPYRN